MPVNIFIVENLVAILKYRPNVDECYLKIITEIFK